MADEVEDSLPVCVDSVRLSALSDCGNTETAISAELSREELYKHALQFYKGRCFVQNDCERTHRHNKRLCSTPS